MKEYMKSFKIDLSCKKLTGMAIIKYSNNNDRKLYIEFISDDEVHCGYSECAIFDSRAKYLHIPCTHMFLLLFDDAAKAQKARLIKFDQLANYLIKYELTEEDKKKYKAAFAQELSKRGWIIEKRKNLNNKIEFTERGKTIAEQIDIVFRFVWKCCEYFINFAKYNENTLLHNLFLIKTRHIEEYYINDKYNQSLLPKFKIPYTNDSTWFFPAWGDDPLHKYADFRRFTRLRYVCSLCSIIS